MIGNGNFVDIEFHGHSFHELLALNHRGGVECSKCQRKLVGDYQTLIFMKVSRYFADYNHLRGRYFSEGKSVGVSGGSVIIVGCADTVIRSF